MDQLAATRQMQKHGDNIFFFFFGGNRGKNKKNKWTVQLKWLWG